MKYDEFRNQLTIKITPWQLKILTKALQLYSGDSPEAAEYPENFWIFKQHLDQEMHGIEFLDCTIDKPDDKGLLGPMPRIE